MLIKFTLKKPQRRKQKKKNLNQNREKKEMTINLNNDNGMKRQKRDQKRCHDVIYAESVCQVQSG